MFGQHGDMAMEFRLLGPLDVRRAGVPVAMGGPREQLVLAALLLRANQTASIAYLVESVWHRPPASPETNLRTYIARLRRRLGAPRLVTTGSGYTLKIQPGELDLMSFQGHLDQARNALASGDASGAARGFEQALRLWRGEPLEGHQPGPALRAEIDSLNERRLATIEQHARVQIELGQHHALIDDLRRQVALHPLREQLWAHLMLALYRAGQRADALDAYLQASKHLGNDAGIDPGPALHDIHAQILSDDPELTATPADTPQPAPAPPRPAQLPADTATFTGRVVELGHLLALPNNGEESPAVAVISAIDGMAGIGKTALAVHAAHQLAHRFPDGQLFLDLHGHTRDVEPVHPAQALDRLLRALGVPGSQVPGHLDDRAALYRTMLAKRRMLIVLDNAHTDTQVQPLLPGGPGCLVLITSRTRLSGLDNTRPLSLDMLPAGDAVALFTATAGRHRLAGEPQELVADVVRLCGRLPLAIRIAAARLRNRPGWTVAHLAERLGDRHHRLAELHAGHRSVTAALDLSHHHLTPTQQHAYRRLGLHPGATLDTFAAAALTNTTPTHARRLLDDLVDAHLLTELAPGRYQFHDLTRAHAAATAHAQDAGVDRRAALSRLFDHYGHATSVAMDLAYPWESAQRPHPPATGTPQPAIEDRRHAEQWLDTELDNLLAAATLAPACDRADHLLHQSATLHRYLRTCACYTDAATLHTHALHHARRTSNHTSEQNALTDLGHIHRMQSRYKPAIDCYQQALDLARRTGSHMGEQDALSGLGLVHYAQGRHGPAADCFEQASAITRRTGNHIGEQDALIGLGWVRYLRGHYKPAVDCFEQALATARRAGNHIGEQDALIGLGHTRRQQGRYGPAIDCYEQGLTIARRTGHRIGEQAALCGLGHTHYLHGRYGPAIDCYAQALDIARHTGHRTGEQNALTGLGRVHYLQGRYRPATDYLQQALDTACHIGDRNFQFEAHQGLGRIDHATGHHKTALDHHHTALKLASDLNQPQDQARAHDGLAHAHAALGDTDHARHHWHNALHLLTILNTDTSEEPHLTTTTIHTHLAALNPKNALP